MLTCRITRVVSSDRNWLLFTLWLDHSGWITLAISLWLDHSGWITLAG